MGEASSLLAFLRDGGIVSMLILIVVGGMRRWYVWDWQYRELEKQRDEWKELARGGTRLADRAVGLAERKDS